MTDEEDRTDEALADISTKSGKDTMELAAAQFAKTTAPRSPRHAFRFLLAFLLPLAHLQERPFWNLPQATWARRPLHDNRVNPTSRVFQEAPRRSA